MKIFAPSSSTTSVLVALCYTTVALKHTFAWTPSFFFSRATNTRTFSHLSSTTTPIVPQQDPPISSENVVAHGTIVSYFEGGLAAIKLKEDDDDETSSSSRSSSSSSSSDNFMGRQVIFPNGAMGMVVAQRPPILFCYSGSSTDNPFMDKEYLEPHVVGEKNNEVSVLNASALVTVNSNGELEDNGVSFVVNGVLGQQSSSLLLQETITELPKRHVFADIPQIKDIQLINSPMLTGITMIDALAPIGKGQNMLVVGSDLQEMRGFAMDMMATQIRDNNGYVIYAITHDKEAAMAELRSRDNLKEVTVVSVQEDHPVVVDPVTRAAEAVTVSATACAIAESLALNSGRDALVIVDTIDDYKVLWDATTRVLVNVFGLDAVVKEDVNGAASSEMRAYYSALIQRAGNFKDTKGGGSVTLVLLTTIPTEGGLEGDSVVFDVGDFVGCGDKIKARLDILVKKNIPLTAVNLRKIDIPIPSEGHRRLVLQHVDDLMSMSDGQVWLDDSLAKMGQSPPVDPRRSLTRVGIGADTASRADAPAIRRMVEGLRLDLVQAAAMQGAERTTASAGQVRKRNAWWLAMHQKPGRGGRTLSESCVALLAASIGALDDTIDSGGLAGTPQGESVMRDLLLHVKTVAPDAIAEIDETQDIGVDRRKELVDAVESFFS